MPCGQRRVPQADLRYRFFTSLRDVSPGQMARLTQIGYAREMAFIAERLSDHATVGVARLVRDRERASGEFALLIEPDAKRAGLARHLMDRLTAWGRAQGLADITGQILSDNHPMLGFVRHIGFSVRHMEDEPDVMEAYIRL